MLCGVIAIADATLYYAMLANHYLCHFDGFMPRLFSYTVFYELTEDSFFRSIKILGLSTGITQTMAFNFSRILNICLCYDLLMVIYKPLSDSEKRIQKFYIIATLFSILTGFFKLFENSNIITFNFIPLALTEMGISAFYAVFATLSLVVVLLRFRKAGFGTHSRNLILQRHIATIICSSLQMFYVLEINILWISADTKHDFWKQSSAIGDWYDLLFRFSFSIAGILLPLSRFLEPAFVKTFKEYAYQCLSNLFCCRKKTALKSDGCEPLFVFLASNLNTELVCAILKGISKFTYL